MTDSDTGMAVIDKLPYPPDGVYYLEETDAPDGYIKLDEPIVVQLDLKSEYSDLNHASISEEEIAGKPYNMTQKVMLSYTIGDKTDTNQIDGLPMTMTVPNEKGTTDFSFTKIWRDSVGEVKRYWPDGKSIKVNILRAKGASDQSPDVYAVYTIGQSDVLELNSEITAKNDPALPALKVIGNSDGTYTFKLEGLPLKGKADNTEVEFIYFVSEPDAVPEYQSPKYYHPDGTQAMGASRIEGGGTIYNDQVGVELPSTGGPGTILFSVVGALTAGAALTVAALRKKERDE